MARKKRSSPYDDQAGRGTGDFDGAQTGVPAGAPTANLSTAGGSVAMTSMSMAGPTTDAATTEGMPSNGLLGAVISVFLFFPLGIFAVAAAPQVRGRWKRGDRTGARESAERAERLTYAAVGVFILIAAVAAVAYLVYWFTGHRH